MSNLIQKYNVPGPRYTSYPTVPYWDLDNFSNAEYFNCLVKSFEASNQTEGISLYIHLPFCESLCTFCGCHKRITKNHAVEPVYIDALIKEWTLYCEKLPHKPNIKEIHLGGGTPTFFEPEQLQRLINGIFDLANKASNFEFSFEGNPQNTTKTHLQTLYDLGFRRVSFGVQDYSQKVQKAINRIQSFHSVAKVTFWAREIGYTSVSHDLVFGLPFQTTEDVIDTIQKTNSLQPDRIAFYSYAHVPWIKGNGQRGFNDEDLPKDAYKRKLYELGKNRLMLNGYEEIGMDHFALKTDSMYKAFVNNNLHRNFMGYTSSKTRVMIGLGVSSISDSWLAFSQNIKNIDEYYKALELNELPVVKGHILTQEDLVIRKHILDLMCQFQTEWDDKKEYTAKIKESLTEMISDELVEIHPNKVLVTEKGKIFVRNICMAFDLRMLKNQPKTQLFSMTI